MYLYTIYMGNLLVVAYMERIFYVQKENGNSMPEHRKRHIWIECNKHNMLLIYDDGREWSYVCYLYLFGYFVYALVEKSMCERTYTAENVLPRHRKTAYKGVGCKRLLCYALCMKAVAATAMPLDEYSLIDGYIADRGTTK